MQKLSSISMFIIQKSRSYTIVVSNFWSIVFHRLGLDIVHYNSNIQKPKISRSIFSPSSSFRVQNLILIIQRFSQLIKYVWIQIARIKITVLISLWCDNLMKSQEPLITLPPDYIRIFASSHHVVYLISLKKSNSFI